MFTTRLAMGVLCCLAFQTAFAGEDGHEKRWTFEKAELGTVPDGWRIAETNGQGEPGVWEIIRDDTAPGGSTTVALSKTTNSGSTFNLLLNEEITLKDLEIEVNVKALAGKEDQGGGPVWRAKDENNYYIARWNPLENNFRVYFVKDGRRKMIATANVDFDPTKWHKIEIEHVGNRITAEVDDKELIEVEDNTFTDAGAIGLWTKADAATAFDEVEAEAKDSDHYDDDDHDDDDDEK